MDEGLPWLFLLFDNQWVWQTFCTQFGPPEELPQRIRPRQFRYQPGIRALVSYVAEWERGRWVVEDQFAIEMVVGKPQRVFRYPDDPYLPGLRPAASGPEAHQLLAKYASISPHKLRVEAVRYRPGSRAVLRHIASWRTARVGKLTLFVRVMPPVRMSRLLKAAEIVERSGLALPQLAGCWAEGGVVWFSRMPGNNVRTHIRKGKPPEPEKILDALVKLWSTSIKPGEGHPLDLLGGFHMTQRLLTHLLREKAARQRLQRVIEVLTPFSEAWRPSALAHNDFYDDQVFLTPDGHLALVDFEETGPGDPLFDVGNMLAHMRWMARFGIAREAYDKYRHQIRSAALNRFGWKAPDLDLREALAIFRLSANPFHQLQRNWPKAIETGLSLVVEALEGVP